MKSRQAFTLVELIVVIAIIGILAGVLIASLSGSGDSANAARCLANMKNLASACQTYGMSNRRYPSAGNIVFLSLKRDNGRWRNNYTESPGWISAMSKDMYPSTSYSKAPSVSLYSDDEEASSFALTNGAIWKYVSGNRNTYVCPLHAKKGGKTGVRPNWSYLMNACFSWDRTGRSFTDDPRIEYGHLARADKRLLFSEVPFSGFNTWEPEGAGGSTDTDAILQYSSSGIDSGTSGKSSGGGSEQLGVNHKKGREAFAHVAFADGHVEKLRIPVKNGKPDTSQMAELASWLAVGYDCSYNEGSYRRVKATGN